MLKKTDHDGGYYAIKGFTYQFDKSLLEILRDADGWVEIENIQDIKTDSFYIQVKHKETQKYADSKIRPAVIQLIECSAEENKATKLYCYFANKKAERIPLDINYLNKILGREKHRFDDITKTKFLNNFVLEFSENFEDQFKEVIIKIKSSFKLKTDEEAITYHAIFQSHLIDVALKKNARNRKVSFSDLELMLNDKEKIIFEVAYSKYLTMKRYLDYVRKEYFIQKTLNARPNERLIIVQVDQKVSDLELMKIISGIENRFHKKDTSPAPYICLYGLADARFFVLKQKLWDHEMFFSDGTHFRDDKFRIKDLIKKIHKDNHDKATFKLISSVLLPVLLNEGIVDEAFVFLTAGDGEWRKVIKDFKEFYVGDTVNVSKIIS